MFSLGELDQDIYYQTILDEEIAYAKAMQNQSISDYEKERWQSMIDSLSSGLSDINLNIMGTGTISPAQTLGLDLSSQSSFAYNVEPIGTEVLTAGFDFSSGWPILGILAIGVFMMFKKEPKRMRSRHRMGRQRRR